MTNGEHPGGLGVRGVPSVLGNPKGWVELERLAAKGRHQRVPQLGAEEWRRLVAADPAVPESYAQLKRLAAQLFDPGRRAEVRKRLVARAPRRGVLRPRVEECGEAPYARLIAGLGNPFLSADERADVERDIDADTPTFEQSTETAHFILRWTNASSNASDNISDSSIVTETGGFLEDAWSTYESTFGRTPYVPAGQTKIEVLFHDISGFGVTTPEGPIELDAPSWVSIPGIRRPTSAHELFHRMQYAYGYRRTWTPVSRSSGSRRARRRGRRCSAGGA